MRVLVGTRERRKSWTPRPLPVFFLLFASGKEKKKTDDWSRVQEGHDNKAHLSAEKREDSLDIAVVCW